MTVVTRFAPSPTGMLHIGGVRTALFSLAVRAPHGGKFILRIEDTDRERSTDEAVQVILDGMRWLGLDADEGPYFQTQRYERYRAVLAQMLEQGQAYRCYCTKEELEAMREQQLARKEKPRYDGRCRERTEPRAGVEPAIRFKNPLDGEVVVDDQVHGRVVFQNAELDDLIIARSDGNPDLQFLRGGGRHGHGHHARDPRRRSSQQHAAADEHAARAGRHAAGVRACADDPRSRRRQAVQAPRRGQRAAVSGRRLSCPTRCSTTWCVWAGRTAIRKFSRARK